MSSETIEISMEYCNSDLVCGCQGGSWITISGACTTVSASLSTMTTVVDSVNATFSVFSESGCNVLVYQTVLKLDGQCHVDGSSGNSYKASVIPACQPPVDFTYSDASGHSVDDLGHYDRCISSGHQYCLLRNGSGLLLGACVPNSCTSAFIQNTSSLIWNFLYAQYLLWLVEPPSDVVALCRTESEFAWTREAYATVSILSLLAFAVLLSSFYSFIYSETPDSQCSCIKSTSLQTQLPRLVCSTERVSRRQKHASADLAALDGVRVLSLSLVILGHSLFFPFSATGFSNILDTLKALGSVSFQVLPSAELAVDSFFMLSGLLGAYLFCKALTKALEALPGWKTRNRRLGKASGSENVQPLLLTINDDVNLNSEVIFSI